MKDGLKAGVLLTVIVVLAALIGGMAFYSHGARAESYNLNILSNTEYFPGEQGQVVAEIRNSTGGMVNANCTVSILYPDKTKFVDAQSMSVSDGFGTKYYSFAVPYGIFGVYEYQASCVIGSKTIYSGKSFHVSKTGNSIDELSYWLTNIEGENVDEAYPDQAMQSRWRVNYGYLYDVLCDKGVVATDTNKLAFSVNWTANGTVPACTPGTAYNYSGNGMPHYSVGSANRLYWTGARMVPQVNMQLLNFSYARAGCDTLRDPTICHVAYDNGTEILQKSLQYDVDITINGGQSCKRYCIFAPGEMNLTAGTVYRLEGRKGDTEYASYGVSVQVLTPIINNSISWLNGTYNGAQNANTWGVEYAAFGVTTTCTQGTHREDSVICNATIAYNESLPIPNPVCYQEFANVSTVCGGLSTGSYRKWADRTIGNNSAYANWIDGNLSTYGTVGSYDGWSQNYLGYDVTYFKPLAASRVGTTFNGVLCHEYGGCPPESDVNISVQIPQECWDYSATNVTLGMRRGDSVAFSLVCKKNNTGNISWPSSDYATIYTNGLGGTWAWRDDWVNWGTINYRLRSFTLTDFVNIVRDANNTAITDAINVTNQKIDNLSALWRLADVQPEGLDSANLGEQVYTGWSVAEGTIGNLSCTVPGAVQYGANDAFLVWYANASVYAAGQTVNVDCNLTYLPVSGTQNVTKNFKQFVRINGNLKAWVQR